MNLHEPTGSVNPFMSLSNLIASLSQLSMATGRIIMSDDERRTQLPTATLPQRSAMAQPLQRSRPPKPRRMRSTRAAPPRRERPRRAICRSAINSAGSQARRDRVEDADSYAASRRLHKSSRRVSRAVERFQLVASFAFRAAGRSIPTRRVCSCAARPAARKQKKGFTCPRRARASR